MDSLSDFIYKKINYLFRNNKLLECAFLHSSYSSNNNERLEFLGDAVLDLIISDWIYNKYPDANEGDLTNIRSFLVKTDTLLLIAEYLHISHWLKINQGSLKQDNLPKSILADAVEAFFASLYLDAGLSKCKELIINIYSNVVKFDNLKNICKDPKSILQEYAQIHFKELPIYTLQDSFGLEHQKCFVVTCAIKGFSYVSHGNGKTKQLAEKDAAFNLMKLIDNEN